MYYFTISVAQITVCSLQMSYTAEIHNDVRQTIFSYCKTGSISGQDETILDCSRFPILFGNKNKFGHKMNPLLTDELVCSKWLKNGIVLFWHFYQPRVIKTTMGKKIREKKRT